MLSLIVVLSLAAIVLSLVRLSVNAYYVVVQDSLDAERALNKERRYSA
jgi:hypothetical protein